MDLPQLFSSKKATTHFLISMIISDHKIQAALWQIDDQSAVPIEISSIKTYQDAEQAVIQSDQALQELGKESEQVDEVVFGLEPGWVGEKGVVDAKKPILKTITDKLGLKAQGYVLTTESLVRHLLSDNPRLSALLIQFSQQMISISLLNQGKLVTSKQVGRSGNTIADMTEALARVNAHTEQDIKLPGKILLASFDLDRGELRDQQQELMDQDWINSHPFVQAPTIDLIDREQILLSILNEHGQSQTAPVAAATTVGAADTQVTQQTATDHEPASAETPGVNSETDPVSSPLPAAPSLPLQVPPHDTPEKDTSAQQSSFSDQPSHVSAESDSSSQPDTSARSRSGSGFGSGSGSKISSQELAIDPELQSPRFGIPMAMKKPPTTDSADELPKAAAPTSFIAKHKPFVIGGFVAGLITLVVGGYIWLGQIVQATVSLDLQTVQLAQDVQITLDPDRTQSDANDLILAAQAIEEQVTGRKTTETTGVKLVGDQAKGTVTIYNKTDSVKTFDQGTQLSKGDLVFTIDETIQVASASVQKSTGSESKEYGSGEVTVTAVEIGTDSNLEEGTELQVDSFDFDTYAATVTQSLTGGSSREVRVVSEQDQNQLATALKQELTRQARQQLDEASKNGNYLVPTGTVTTDQIAFDAEIGDEVSSITVEMTVTVEALSYKADDLKPLAQAILEDDVPDGFSLADSEPEILSTPEEASNSGQVVLEANVSAKAQPILDTERIKSEISGQSIEEATNNLLSNDHIKAVKINLHPAIAEKIRARLPKDPAKINIQ